MSYTLLYCEDGVTKDISDFASSIQFSGDSQSAVRKLDVSLINGTDAYIPKLKVRNGGTLILRSGESEIIRAVIFKQEKDDKGSFRVSGYTHGIYLVKNKDTRLFTNVTATQIIREICQDFGIPTGTIVDIQEKLDKKIFREKTLWDMIQLALIDTTKKTGIKYRVFFKEGKLNVCEKRKQEVTWVLEEGVNLLSANISNSIEDMKNKIKVIGKLSEDYSSNGLMYIAQNEEMQKLYGIMQEIKEESDDKATEEKIKSIAENLLKELCKEQIETNIDALGIDEIESGMAVYVTESVTGLTGVFYVEEDSHSIEGNNHTMKLKLSKTEDIYVANEDI